MWPERIRRYLVVGEAERDEQFRLQIRRLSHFGLQVLGWAQLVLVILMTAGRFLLAPEPELGYVRLWEAIIVGTMGALMTLASRVPYLYAHARKLALANGVILAAVVVWFSLLKTAFDPSADDFILGQITLVILVGVAAVPFRPSDTLLFGLLTEVIYIALTYAAHSFWVMGTGVDAIYVLYIFMLTLMATALTALLYEQRRSAFEVNQSILRAAEDLRIAESRNLLSQNAASVGRLAAALSHELNSPVGALISGVDTLLLLTSRQATSTDPAEQQRLVRLQADLRRSIQSSTTRLGELVARMQRFTNLDKAEVQSANINEILNDVAALLEPQWKDRAVLTLDLQPVPDLICRPQQLSAVFSNLLGNAVEALNGQGTIAILTRQKEDLVEVEIRDNGRGVSRADLEVIFDPGFRVNRGRVTTGNWSMFSSRQIIREHGGEIRIDSEVGQGTTVSIVLPCGECHPLLQPVS